MVVVVVVIRLRGLFFVVKVVMWWCVHEGFLIDLYRPAQLEIMVMRVVVNVSNIR